MINWIRNESKILLLSFILGIIITVGFAAYTYTYAAKVQANIANNVIRFHVMANSDTPEDQALKDNLRAQILEDFAHTLAATTSIEESREVIAELLPTLQNHAENFIRDAGFDLQVTATLTSAFFPTQYYGDIAFPPGNYEPLQITIGDGAGENWWCLMFPPLCYVDISGDIQVLPEESRLALMNMLPDDAYTLVAHTNDNLQTRARFWIVERWMQRSRPANDGGIGIWVRR
jgi:stage II sporulation protein R